MVAVLLTSCQDPVYKTKREARDARIREALASLEAREQRSPGNLNELEDTRRRFRKQHEKQLEQTLKMIERRHRRANDEWLRVRPLREDEIKELLGGEPEDIPEIWAKLIY